MTTTKTRIRILLGMALLLPLATACEQRTTTVLTGHAVHGRDVAKLAIGRSTRGEVEQLLGTPDERGPDGSLVYRAAAVRQTGHSIGGIALPSSDQVVSTRSTTFRFDGEVLTRICRERS